MKKLFEKYVPKEYRFYILMYLVLLAVHLVLPLNWGDDKIFVTKSADAGLVEFLQGSARPFTDALTYIFSRFHFLWRVLNPVVLTVLVAVIPQFVPDYKDSKTGKIITCIALYPTMCMVDAGFVATTVNYLWPVTFGLLGLLPMKRFFYGEKTKWYYCILLLPLLVYATNMQQMCVVLLAVLLLGNIYFALKKKVNFYLVLQTVIVGLLAFYSYSLNMFGDNNRMVREIGRYFPEFLELSIFEKAELGFSSTFYALTSQLYFPIVIFLAFTVFISVVTFKTNKSTMLKIISLLPPIVSVVLSLLPDNVKQIVFGELKNYKMTKAVYSFEPIADIIFIIIVAIMLINILSLVNSNGKRFYCVIILGLGLGSRMLMGFSPTVWASGCRTFCIMFITFILTALLIVTQKEQKKNDTKVYMPS